jgi:hypothetical protein
MLVEVKDDIDELGEEFHADDQKWKQTGILPQGPELAGAARGTIVHDSKALSFPETRPAFTQLNSASRNFELIWD